MSGIDVSELDFAQLTPSEFARLVKDASKAELAEVMAGGTRERVLDEIFTRMQQQFLPEKAGSRRAVVHWNVTGRPDGGVDAYEMVIADGSCTVEKPPSREATATVTVDGVEFLKLVSGNASATTQFFTKKLTLQGDLGLGAGLTNMFDIPKP